MHSQQTKEIKRYRKGTHRTRVPADTLARVRPWMREMGITRIANITGLDRLGIPVVMACRPNSRSISVSQGKGYDLDAAKASAVMEAVETWHAEHICQPLRYCSREDLEQEGLVIADIARLPHLPETTLTPSTSICWIQGQDLVTDAPCWLPLELVATDYTLPGMPGCGYFPANTNGLASGNTLQEAICHGIYEVVERDAEALWKQMPLRKQRQRIVSRASINDPGCRMLLDKFSHAGITTRLWDVTSDVGIAAFVCLAAGAEDDWADPEFGAGCHPAREVALSRALTEAAQARTTYIAGVRDDVGAWEYDPQQRLRRRIQSTAMLADNPELRNFPDIVSRSYDTMGEDLSWVLGQLQQAGIEQVLAVDLSKERLGLAVVRVVIPGLEGACGHGSIEYSPGERAKALLNFPPGLAP